MTGPVRVRKRPIELEAYRYDGTNAADIVFWVLPQGGEIRFTEGELVVHTYDGWHVVPAGHTLIRGTRTFTTDEGGEVREFYPLRPDVYGDCYEELGP